MNLRRQITAFLLLLPITAMAIPYVDSAQNSKEILEDRDYKVLSTPLPTSTGDKIEVREFFWYGCPHCFDLEHAVNSWLTYKPKDVQFVRTPAILNDKWAILGRAFYVAEELKVADKMHSTIYNAIHLNGEQLVDQASIGKFFARNGVQPAQFDAAWNSFSVNTKVKNAGELARKYMVTGTPTLTVAGKYVVPAAGEKTFAVVDFLVNKERAARGTKK